MEDNDYLRFDQLKAEAIKHHNEAILMGFDVCRLIGVGEDFDDFYYILKYPRYPDGKIVHHSAVGSPIYLKGKIESNRYDGLDQVLELNGSTKEPEPLIKSEPLKTHISTWKQNTRD